MPSFHAFFVLASLCFAFLVVGKAEDEQLSACLDQADTYNDAVCYEFVESTDVTNYDDAANYCQAKGKQLANVRSQEQMNFISKMLTSKGWEQAFIGLRYVRTGWKWIATNRPLRGQGCSQTSYSVGSKLLSTLSTSMTIEGCINFCSKNRLLYAAVQQSSFCYCSSSYIWPESSSDCKMPCAGSEEQTCGGPMSSMAYITADFAYDNWQNGRPALHGICAAISVDRNINPWVDISCSMTLPFICRTSTVKYNDKQANADSYLCGFGVCYYLYTTVQKTWLNADRYCAERGGRLAAIDVMERQDVVDRLLFPTNLPRGTNVWIGAANYQWYQQGNFSSTRDLLTFDGWVTANEPVAPETYPCVSVVTLTTGRYGMKTAKCSDLGEEQNRFICTQPSIYYVVPSSNGTKILIPTTTPVPEEQTEDPFWGRPVLKLEEETTTSEMWTSIETTAEASTIMETSEVMTTTTPLETTTTTTVSETTSTTSVFVTTAMVQVCNATCRNLTTPGSNLSLECYNWDDPNLWYLMDNSSVWFHDIVPCSILVNATIHKMLLRNVQAQAVMPMSSTMETTTFPWWAILVVCVGGTGVITAAVLGTIFGLRAKRAAAMRGHTKLSPKKNQIAASLPPDPEKLIY